jgi:saxitoxin biosynthesis operon SxtJ-like protein
MEGDRELALGISTGLSVREGRRFGLTVGPAFLVLGGLAWWRGRVPVAGVFWVVAGLLLLAALLAPARLQPVERVWMRWARLMSQVTTPILIGVLYFVVITPMAILMRALGRNPLASRHDRDTLWVARGEARRSDLHRQF